MIKAQRRASIPLSIHIGYLSQIDKRDAIARVAGLIRRQVTSPEVAYWYLRKVDDGYAYEIQEGGAGRAYLPGILAAMVRDPEEEIVLRTAGRAVRISGNDGRPTSAVLPEDSAPEFSAIGPSARMRRFAPTGVGPLLTAGIFFASAALGFLLTSLTVNHAREQWDKNTDAGIITRINDLPLSHWPKSIKPGEYVTRVQFVDGHWRTSQRRANNDPALPPGLPGALDAAVHAEAVSSARPRSSGVNLRQP